MYAYAGTGAGTLTGTRSTIGTGWAGHKIYGIRAFNAATNKGVMTIKPDGTLWFYQTASAAWGAAPYQVGSGWYSNYIMAGH